MSLESRDPLAAKAKPILVCNRLSEWQGTRTMHGEEETADR